MLGMRILFVAGGSSGVIFSLIPLAQAARNAGHQVFVAGAHDVVHVMTGAGLPAVRISDHSMMDTMVDRKGDLQCIPKDLHERYLFNGRCFGRFAAHCLDGLLALADHWHPDLVVGGALAFAAPLVAAHAGVRYVKHAVDMGEPRTIDLAAAAELGPELERLGLYDMPRADLFVDTCPPSLRLADAPPAQLMRYVPYTTPRAVEPWMYTKGDRPRLLVSAGSRVTPDRDFEILSGLVAKVEKLDVELLIGAPDEVAEKLQPLPDNVRAGWLPLDVLAPTCDLVMHHAGGNTTLGNMAHGVPQVLIPYLPYVLGYSTRLSEYGAAKIVDPEDDSADNIVQACQEVLDTPSFTERAREIAAEMAALPIPAEVVGALENVAVR
jgi:glycosyltransferase